LFSRKKLTCQVKFVPIYIETPDLTELLVSLLTCLKKKKKKRTGLAGTGLDSYMEKVIWSPAAAGGMQKGHVLLDRPPARLPARSTGLPSSKSEVDCEVYEHSL
jgi:hypothetical protein